MKFPATFTNSIGDVSIFMNGAACRGPVLDGDKREVLVYDFERNRIAERYSFDEKIPVGISEMKLCIDLSQL